MIDFNKIGIDKNTLNHNDRVLCVDISCYDKYDQVVVPFLATVKLSEELDLFFDEEGEANLYSDHKNYIVIKVLEREIDE